MHKKQSRMTKKQVAANVNALIEKHIKALTADIDKLLNEADMWYGYWQKGDSLVGIVNSQYPNDRNADLLANDGGFDDSVDRNLWLHTRNELGIGKKKPNK